MRLWSLHPRYLDARGLTACWREGLLAQAVLQGIAGLAGDGKFWKVVAADVSATDKAAGVIVSCQDSSGVLRVTLNCPESRDVKWTLQFKPQSLPGK